MKNQKAMLIIGAAGSGKTRRAWQEAQKRGGELSVTSWEEIAPRKAEIRNTFRLGRMLHKSPQVVIVEGLSLGALTDASVREFLKQLISGDAIEIEEKYKSPRMVPAPTLIYPWSAGNGDGLRW